MSRGKSKAKKSGFVDVGKRDSSDEKGHLSPVPVGMRSLDDAKAVPVGTVAGVAVYESADVPVGQWVNVPKGMTVVEGCYVDPVGILRFIENNAPAVWHHPSGCKYHQPPCKRRITDPSEIFYDDNNAPWCPDCVGWTKEDEEFKARDAAVVSSEPIPIRKRTPEERTEYLKNAKEANPHLANIIEAVGDFNEVGDEEFGVRRRVVMTEEEIQRLSAASAPQVPEVFRNQASKKRFYPSGAPRRW
jgi:hypothetical protein